MWMKGTLISLFTLAFTTAWADGVVTLETEGQPMIVEFAAEGELLRMEDGSEEGYLLMRDGKLYSVIDQGGKTMVLDLGAAMSMMGGNAQQGGVWDDDAVNVDAIKATGTKQTVAGIEGEVYQVTSSDRDGQSHTVTMVLSENETLVEFTQSFFRMAEIMAKAMQREAPDFREKTQELLGQTMGILQHEDSFKVIKVEDKAIDAKRFELPAKPMDMSMMGRR